MKDLGSLKQELANALSKEDVNFNEILALAGEMAKLDENNIRFSVDASHITRLGVELVSKQETAVAELIKNAYDADATTVDLIFDRQEQKGGVLKVIDTGHGMSRQQLLNGFMRISTQDKVDEPMSVKYGRQRAGRKGIGRFAAQRLGERLVIETQRESEDFSLRLEIDWNQFERGRDLYLITNALQVRPRLPRVGTSLRIDGLRDAWSSAQILRSLRYVSELMQPFPLAMQDAAHANDDPGFKIAFYRMVNEKPVVIADDRRSVLSHAAAHISGEVNERGEPFISMGSSRFKIEFKNRNLEFEEKIKPRTGLTCKNYDALSGVKFSAHYFIQEELPTGSKALVREVLNHSGGIRIYRNGFRVLPYGEQFDDWLGLQRSSALRGILPPHHNNNFLGFVEIHDVDGRKFEETASREGLLENDAFFQLQDFVFRALLAGVIEIARARGRKIFASDSGSKRDERLQKSPQEEATEVADEIRRIAAGASASHEVGGGREQVRSGDAEELAKRIESLGTKAEKVLAEVGMLRVLASLGLVIGEFTHEVRHTLAAISSTISGLGNDHEFSGSSGVSSLKASITVLQSYMRYFDDAVVNNVRRDLGVHEVRDIVNDFSEVMESTLSKKGVTFTKKFNGYDLFVRPSHKSEWSSVLLNLFTNSLKAIDRAGVSGRIHFEAKADSENVIVDFSDNGDGVPFESRERIFDAFYSTSAPTNVMSSDAEKLTGTGLGLKIIRDIIEAMGGSIYLVEAESGFSTCFRIEVPRATDEEVGDARY
ncbi:MAG: sensor histidine kinase [Moraxellaceae bacterium]|nr:sensor histidine kinase [Moraxellaceae bacterium]